ncbi:hypothetical protein QCE47_11925 [Caballeronia sp. LZ025]|uniref:hypothetical protein n=1 Tax=Caballeronia TaxID=1827195 RepID=UPI001FD41751|nr:MULTISPECIES: hypothetical protein [Caballeronia]MDR5733048.1 hypothetical protein [Caballeronia sp. LZ025]
MEIIVETFRAFGEASAAAIRVRPLAGQGFSTALRVECSRSMRQQYPVGTLFRLAVKPIERGTPLLYAHHAAPFERVTRDEAQRSIAEKYRRTDATML